MFQWMCECVEQLGLRPSVANVLERSAGAQLCTTTQCFESIEDMIPGLVASVDDGARQRLLLLFAFLVFMIAARPPRLSSHKSHPPPPPPPPMLS